MDAKEIFNEILKSPKMKEMLKIPVDSEIEETFDGNPQHKEVAVVRHIIEGQLRNTSEDGIFNSIKRLFDL